MALTDIKVVTPVILTQSIRMCEECWLEAC